MKILMAVDQSEFSKHAAQAVARQFRPAETEVRVVHVLQPAVPAVPSVPPVPQMSAGYAPELEDEVKPAQALVDGIAGELRQNGFQASTAVVMGDTRESIIDRAAEWGADLIVVGSHGHRGIRRLLLGSVAEFVARHAHCSVQIVR
jgi:nucleotide-binding universal stress UspA family protein